MIFYYFCIIFDSIYLDKFIHEKIRKYEFFIETFW